MATIGQASLLCFHPGHLGGVHIGKIDENFFLELIRCESHVGEMINTLVVLRKKQAPSVMASLVTQSSGFAKVVIGVVVVVVVVLVVAGAGGAVGVGQSLPWHSWQMAPMLLPR